jgi:1-deoxy-D-xylulose-5-phosphate synthase
VYSTFLQRAFDQAFQESCLQGLPVRLCLDRAGLVGGDGAVHHGFCDVSILRTLPGAVLTAAMDEPSLIAALEFMRGYDAGLSSVRYPRDSVSQKFANEKCPAFVLGKARCLTPTLDVVQAAGLESGVGSRGTHEGVDVVVMAFGTAALEACAAAEQLAGEARVCVYDARFAKPVDRAVIRGALERGLPIVTIEDHSVVGGFGTAVLEAAAEMGLDASLISRLGLPDSWVYQDSRAKQMSEVGLDVAGVVKGIRGAISRREQRVAGHMAK